MSLRDGDFELVTLRNGQRAVKSLTHGEVMHPSVPTRNYMETLGGSASWTATPADMVRILDSLDNTKPGFHPLSDEMTSRMRQPQSGVTYDNRVERWYGLATIV